MSSLGLRDPALRALAIALCTASALAPDPARADPPGLTEPLAGFSGDQLFFRSADNSFVAFPGAELQFDDLAFVRPTDEMPEHTMILRRARLEVGGWIGPYVYYKLSGDFAPAAGAAQGSRRPNIVGTTDNYFAFAPSGDSFILQGGQFDAPFTFENRTRDTYLDFMERSLTVRAFGIPTNKEVGLMAHGALAKPFFRYSFAALNGDGHDFRDLGAHLDLMGRVAVHPAEVTPFRWLTTASVGFSLWYGMRGPNTLAAPAQTTQGGFQFFTPTWTLPGSGVPVELRQEHGFWASAIEVNVPILHRFGARVEYVHKSQPLAEQWVGHGPDPQVTPLGDARLDGASYYVEGWCWLVGNDRLLPEPASQFPTRLTPVRTTPPRHGLMIAVRGEYLAEELFTDTPALGNPGVGTTEVTSVGLGMNYWYSRRFRATVNYTLNILEGSAASVMEAKRKNGGKSLEQELGIRLAVAL
jgi:hypothetical protein